MEWIISANHNKYDHVRAFKELPYIDWKQNANYSVGDKVFIYSTKPVSAIEFLVDVIETDITSDNVIDDKNYWVDMGEYEKGRKYSKYTRFKLVEHFDTSQITIDELHKNGLIGNIQGPRKLYDEMGNLLEFGQYIHNSLSIFKKDKTRAKIMKQNDQLDDMLKTVITDIIINPSKIYSYSDVLKPKPKLVENKFNKVYKRNKAVAINIYIPSLRANDIHTKQVETIDFIISLFAFLNSIIQTAIIDNIECTPKFIGNNLITLIIKPKHIPYFNTFSLSILIPSNIIPDNTTTILSGKVLVII